MKTREIFSTALLLLAMAMGTNARADLELYRGSVAGCPFIHEDAYDLGPILETLKIQLETRLQGKNNCLQSMQSIYSSLSAFQNFYRGIDPALKQKLARGVYSSALKSLEEKKLLLEMSGQTSSIEYSYVMSQIATVYSSNLENDINMKFVTAYAPANQEAIYRTQLLGYTSSLLDAYTSTARSNPQCISTMGGWNQALSALMGGFSIATGMGMNPTTQIIGASASAAAQFISLLKDSKVRSAYNDLIKLKNSKTLACTYYAMQRSTCEYLRAYRVSEDVAKLRQYLRNQFSTSTLKGEYDRFFTNQGRIGRIGEIFYAIIQMGSPITLDRGILFAYISAKAVDFKQVGTPPKWGVNSEAEIKEWLIRARTLGINYSEIDQNNQTIILELQLKSAVDDLENKKRTIEATTQIIRKNKSFLDLRRYLSSEFPNALPFTSEMINYLRDMRDSPIVGDLDRITIDAAITLLLKLEKYIEITSQAALASEPGLEDLIIDAGIEIFEELAKGSIAQLTQQSVFAISERGVDRLMWAFNVAQNAYLGRDSKLPVEERFLEYSKKQNVLSDVTANYRAFIGPGSTYRDMDFLTSAKTFREAFKGEILKSLEKVLEEDGQIPELEGITASHACALYAPALEKMSRGGFFGSNKASRILYQCEQNYKTLKLNKLVSDKDFAIDYEDDCTYINYTREFGLQNLVSQLIQQ